MTFRCENCGQPYAKWQGQCTACDVWGEIKQAKGNGLLYRQENSSSYRKNKSSGASWVNSFDKDVAMSVQRMNDVDIDTLARRIRLPDKELNWVLGGGLVVGSLTLVGGEPGVGKSTLALQIANMLANKAKAVDHVGEVLYVSGEESALQVKMRAERLGDISDDLFVVSETNIDHIIQMIEHLPENSNMKQVKNGHKHFGAVVIDSIQTVFAEDIPSAAGTVNQVKECTLRLLRLSKYRNIPVIIIGHVTKSGDLAGPKVLEHIVDTVLQLEGDPQSARRFLRCQKNRFGNTSEVGVFNMTDAGLQALQNPLMAFISTEEELENAMKLDEDLDGTSITIAMEGSRPIPLEIQALSGKAAIYHDGGMKNSFSRVRGVGVAFDKLQLLFAVLERRARISFQSKSVFVNVAEGYSIQEPAADLAVAIALASAATKRQVVQKTAFLGEIALSGYIRPVKMLESRLSAAHKIGIETCIVPPIRCEEKRKSLKKYHQDLKIVEAVTLFDALQYALPSKS